MRLILKALRVKQWTKNLLLFVAILFAGQFTDTHKLGNVCVGLLSFCLLSSVVYIINDISDREQDRLHPTKRLRPFASGALSLSTGYLLAGLCFVVSMFIGWTVSYMFMGVEAIYLALSFIYNFGGKHVVILDILLIASGFVMRTYAGAVAADVATTGWLFSFAMMGSCLLGFCKRRSEILELEHIASDHRPTLGEYDVNLLDQFISICASSCIITYGLYAIMSPTADHHKLLPLTIPIMLYGLFRYVYLVFRKGMGGSPELVFLEDRPITISVILFTIATILAFTI